MNMKTWIAAGALAVVVVGGSITGATVHNASVQADAQAQADQKSVSLKIDRMTSSVGDDVQTLSDATIQANAAAQAVIDAKAAADALAAQQAAQAAADAAAAQAAQQAAKAPVKRAAGSSASWAPGQAPTGTPLPHHTETDPNNGNFGQQTYEDPGQFCASRSGSTIGGVPQCD